MTHLFVFISGTSPSFIVLKVGRYDIPGYTYKIRWLWDSKQKSSAIDTIKFDLDI